MRISNESPLIHPTFAIDAFNNFKKQVTL
jgi:hypothetical protein